MDVSIKYVFSFLRSVLMIEKAIRFNIFFCPSINSIIMKLNHESWEFEILENQFVAKEWVLNYIF